jgi:predicted dehydrogenase
LFRFEGLGDYHYQGTSAYDPSWRADAGRGGGGALLDNGYHSIYLARYVMQSEVKEVFGAVGTFARDFDVEDTALAIFRHANGALTSIQNGWGADRSTSVREVQGTAGSLVLSGESGKPIELWRGADCEYPEPLEDNTSGFAPIFSAYCDALDGKGPVPTSAADGLMNLRIILAAYEASRTGSVVEL